MHKPTRILGAIATAIIIAMATAALPQLTAAYAVEQPVTPEHNPPGDIPDSQVFIAYSAPGFTLQVPEGWSRTDIAGGASFSDKFNSMSVTEIDSAIGPTIASVQNSIATDLVANGHVVTVRSIGQVKLNGGQAIRVEYQANSMPNAVTGKQIRLECVRYLYAMAGKLLTLDMAAPAGADNVDQWLLMANSVELK
ncbi:hypothetical protein [Devosia sp.]|uniref:hypothetical protein n=1 Tax=Devosia sp. TaxID=1871048 RepID=UPI0032642168